MKAKDIFAFGFLALILIIIGSFLVGKLGGGKAKHHIAQIEVVQTIDPTFSQDAQNILLGRDPKAASQNFSTPLNLQSGFGNSDPFTP